MNEATEDAIARLTAAVLEEPETRVSFVIGAGLSHGRVPAVNDMVDLFCAELGSVGESVKEQVARLDAGEAYQEAARRLVARRGARAAAGVIRKAVLRAAPGHEASDPAQVPLEAWNTSKGHNLLARLYALLPPHRRGPIYTTNFDPLIEVAFAKKGLGFATLNANDDIRLAIQGIGGAVPIIHLHGFWQDGATLNTPLELARGRPGLEASLVSAMRSSLVCVMGYGGWTDSFARSLLQLAQGTSFSILDVEIAWITHSDASVAANSEVFRAILGTPGVSEYVAADATAVLEGALRAIEVRHAELIINDVPDGWEAVPPRPVEASAVDVSVLLDGAAPTWGAAAAAPLLHNGIRLATLVERAWNEPGFHAFLAMGPTGEGKTVALMQAALRIASASSDGDQQAVLFRLPGATRITDDWLRQNLRNKQRVALFVDDADLLLEELSQALGGADISQLGIRTFLLVATSHEHGTHSARIQAALTRLDVSRVVFSGIDENDATDLAEFWDGHSVLPARFKSRPEAVSSMVYEASLSPNLMDRSLFASLLHLWEPVDLQDRVHDLLERVHRYKVRGHTLSSALLAIAVVEDGGGRGLTTGELARMLEVSADDILPIVIRPLGREAGVSLKGAEVFTRHAEIARTLVSSFHSAQVMSDAVMAMGLAAGRAFKEGLSIHQVPALFSPRNMNDPLLPKLWARSMLSASGNLLRARVTFMTAHRKSGNTKFVEHYASEVYRHYSDFDDWRNNFRGFLCEWAFILIEQDRPMEALQRSLEALADRQHVPLYPDLVSYALAAGSLASRRLRDQGVEHALDLHGTFRALHAAAHGSVDLGAVRLLHQIAGLRAKSVAIMGESVRGYTYREFSRLMNG